MTPRKPTATAAASHPPLRLPLPQVRRRIWEAACELVADGDTREISSVLASRFHASERTIDAVLVAEGMRHERVAAALRTGLASTLQLAREAEAAEYAA